MRASKGYRWNCWMIPDKGRDNSIEAALCLDRQDRVHLVVLSDDPKQSLERLPLWMRELVVTSLQLRAALNQEASVLDRRLPVAGIVRVPDNCTESFGTTFINSLLERNYRPEDFSYQFD